MLSASVLLATFRRTGCLLALALAGCTLPLHAAAPGKVLIVVSGEGRD